MENIIQVDATTGVAYELQQYIRERLAESGWALVKVNPSEDMEEAMWSITKEVGLMLKETKLVLNNPVGYHVIKSTGADKPLPVHTEGVSNPHGIIPYLALGCIVPSVTGGETRVIDGRKAAALLLDQRPEFAEVKIRYSTMSNPEVGVIRPLIAPGYRALRYRGRVASNSIVNSGGLTDDEVYRLTDEATERSVVLEHYWEAGHLLFLNNLTMLHNRGPYEGDREMARFRFKEEIYPKYCYL